MQKVCFRRKQFLSFILKSSKFIMMRIHYLFTKLAGKTLDTKTEVSHSHSLCTSSSFKSHVLSSLFLSLCLCPPISSRYPSFIHSLLLHLSTISQFLKLHAAGGWLRNYTANIVHLGRNNLYTTASMNLSKQTRRQSVKYFTRLTC